jgi:glycosyltransferase involved in cell wall biosynthesis
VNYLATSDRFFGDSPGGSHKIAWEVTKLMRRAGHSVALLCGSLASDPPPGLSEEEGITVVRYRFPQTPTWDPLKLRRHVLAARTQAVRSLGNRRWDVVHAHVPASALAVFGQVSGEAERIYSIHSPHVLEQRINWADGSFTGNLKVKLGMPVMARGERLAYSGAHRLSADSQFTRASIETLFGAGISSRITVIPWWAERAPTGRSKQEARRLLGWPLHRTILLSLRRMVPRMGLSVLLDAVEPLSDRHDFLLVLAGEGPDAPALQRQAASGRAFSRVIFPGRLTDAQVTLAYQAADLFVLPTVALECFGIIVLEAFAHGVPVIASNVGAIPEIIEPVSPHCLFPAGDSNALRGMLDAYLQGSLGLPDAGMLIAYAEAQYARPAIEREYLSLIYGGKGFPIVRG